MFKSLLVYWTDRPGLLDCELVYRICESFILALSQVSFMFSRMYSKQYPKSYYIYSILSSLHFQVRSNSSQIQL